ncbi:UDP-2,4-diacetamido-2,4,6-trideoxy-beta-L-altropyranose hydrolase [Akkermansiaceae bacterium]|nr:UDP-2,4-diacetamido-2,4,6-trideoxy-beta-L-altropyranose hydrolase [Akkermansiaceae bacterium]
MSTSAKIVGQPLLLFRADAGPSIGMGHVMRCLGLAQRWQDRGGRAAMVMAQSNKSVEDRLHGEGVTTHVLGVEAATISDATATARTARETGASWIVADGYNFERNWLTEVAASGIPLALWADYVQSSYLPVSLLLNQNPHVSTADYAKSAAGATLLLGLRYSVLRREFLQYSRVLRRKRVQGVGRLLVTLGGSDPVNATRKVLLALSIMGKSAPPTTVVIGANNPRLDELRELASGRKEVELLYAVNDMPALMDTCDLAISGGGTTLWELAYMGVPSLAIVLAENQVPLVAALSHSEAGIDLGWAEKLDPHCLARLLIELIADKARVANMSSSALQLVDEKGADRVCEALQNNR